ncbi:MAG TPA: alpha/beta fold hydrolase [Marmoricola sp.]|jgi:pimeloyl-ACP methyl ester carboxylesterase|nr:alpha/beta fold hydrolase [Marmoricola sp.]
MALLEVNGVQVNVEDTGAPPGKPDAPVVVLGHGLLFSTTMWRHQVEALRASYRCVAIDWRGQGRTPPTRSGYDMDALYADAVGVIEALDVGPVHYAGLSMGGFVGQRLAARRPDLVRSLTLIDTSAEAEDPAQLGQYRLLARLWTLVGWRPLRSRVAPIMFTPAFLATPDGKAVLRQWTAELDSQTRRGITGAVRGVLDRRPIAGEIGRIAAPTLVIVGAADPTTPPARAEAIAAAIPGARLEVLPDVGHVSTLQAPDAINAMVVPFLAAN